MHALMLKKMVATICQTRQGELFQAQCNVHNIQTTLARL